MKVKNKNNEIEVDGSPAWSGIITTKSGLIISASSFVPKLDVYDQKNGELIHSMPLKYTASANPMTFFYKDKQYIVLMLADGGNRIDDGNILSVYSH